MSEEKKIEEKEKKKANKFQLAFEKFKETSNKLLHHPFVEKYINYISFSVIILILIFVRLQNPEFVKSISNISFDSYQKIFKFDERRDNLVIVDIDEPSLAKFGQFPWSRNVFSEILENINQDNPKSVGFDIFFSEKDKHPQKKLLKLTL